MRIYANGPQLVQLGRENSITTQHADDWYVLDVTFNPRWRGMTVTATLRNSAVKTSVILGELPETGVLRLTGSIPAMVLDTHGRLDISLSGVRGGVTATSTILSIPVARSMRPVDEVTNDRTLYEQLLALIAERVPEPPDDGQTYLRRHGEWVAYTPVEEIEEQ